MTTSCSRPAFEPDSVPDAVQDSSSPIINTSAIARFEFEPGRGNAGTKIQMVEWEDAHAASSSSGEWHVSWEGKKTVLPVVGGGGSGDSSASTRENNTRRLYFLLQPSAAVPPLVTITHLSKDGSQLSVFEAKNLPAIYPPELGAVGRAAGKKGVLHTIWAKQRMAALRREIVEEEKINLESIALEMAREELDWIERNFGLVSPQGGHAQSFWNAESPGSPTSPRSPGGGRLAEKLKGLKLGTDAKALGSSKATPSNNPLSPEQSDVAISSFSSLSTGSDSAKASATSHSPSPAQNSAKDQRLTPSAPGRTVPAGSNKPVATRAVAPPAALRAQQGDSHAASFSLAGALAGNARQANGDHALNTAHLNGHASQEGEEEEEEEEEDLFAVAMSPRSPDDPKSPFSFESRDPTSLMARRI